MPRGENSCRVCQSPNPLGMRFCGVCGNLLITPSRGAALRRPGWFERKGSTRFLGIALGPSGVATVLALGVFTFISLTLWVETLYREGRILHKEQPAITEAPVRSAPPKVAGTKHRRKQSSLPPSAAKELPRVAPETSNNTLAPPQRARQTDRPLASAPEAPSHSHEKLASATPTTLPEARQPLSPVPNNSSPSMAPPEATNTSPLTTSPLQPSFSPAVIPPSAPPQSTQAPSALEPRSPAPSQPVRPSLPRLNQGDLIWSGQLERGMLLTIDGLRTSLGSLRGDPLPGVPVFVTVQPADLIVAQAPMSSDDYRRLVIRSPSRRNTVVRVHWEILK